jgi:hypothetical protein
VGKRRKGRKKSATEKYKERRGGGGGEGGRGKGRGRGGIVQLWGGGKYGSHFFLNMNFILTYSYKFIFLHTL